MRPIDPETLVYGLAVPDDPQMSPNGDRLVYSLTTGNREKQQMTTELWVCDVDGHRHDQLTRTTADDRKASGGSSRGARWSPDGDAIAFVSNRVKKSGVFVLPMNGAGEPREITRHNQGISDLAWSPDGQQLAYTTVFDPENPDESGPEEGSAPRVRVTTRIDYKQDGRGYLNDTRLHVWVVDVTSGERRRLTETPLDHAFPQWSPDGTRIAAQVSSMNGMHSQLTIIDVASGDATTIGPEDGVIGAWSWSPSGDRIIYAGDTDRTWQLDWFVHDIGSGETRRLTDDLPSLPVSGSPGDSAPSQPVWLDNRQVLFHAMRAGGSGLSVIDSEQGTVEPTVQWQAQHGGFSVGADHRFVVQSRTSLDEVGEIVRYDLQSNELQTLTSYSQQLLGESPAAEWERIDIERGGYTIEAWLLKPRDFDESRQYPVVLDIHGGPNGHYGYAFTPLHELLATNGFLLVYSNPRGSSSYGREFTQQVTEDWGGEDYLDLMAVLDKVLERPYADATRTGISGYSYGGYMTAWTIGQTDRFKAAVCGAPCFDLESMYGTSDISHVFGELQWGGPPHESKEWYERHSPSTYAHRCTTPTLIVHGEADERCPIGQGEQMFIALKKAGCDVEFARYPGGAHGFRRGGHPEHRRDCWQRTLEWFQRHLG